MIDDFGLYVNARVEAIKRLGFRIKRSGGGTLIEFADGSIRPASEEEVALWNFIDESARSRQVGPRMESLFASVALAVAGAGVDLKLIEKDPGVFDQLIVYTKSLCVRLALAEQEGGPDGFPGRAVYPQVIAALEGLGIKLASQVIDKRAVYPQVIAALEQLGVKTPKV